MLPDEEMLAAAMEQLKWAAHRLRYEDRVRSAVEQIEAAVKTDSWDADVSVPVTLTLAAATSSDYYLVAAHLTLHNGKVKLVRTHFDVDLKHSRSWWNLPHVIRDDVAHAVPALAVAVAAALLERSRSLRSAANKAKHDESPAGV